jgi:2-dehydro-3-deoxygluconokinase
VTTVVTLGECLTSFVALEGGPLPESSTFLRTVAGAEANVAVGLARLGHAVAFIGRVGGDGLGTGVLRRLRGEGVDVSHLARDERAATGVMIREVRAAGTSEVVYWRRGSAGSRLSAQDVRAAEGLFGDMRWLHVTGVTPALSPTAAAAVDAAIDRARLGGATVSLDLNIRRQLWSEEDAAKGLAAIAARCDVVLGGLEEVALTAGRVTTLAAGGAVDPETAAEAMLGLGPRSVVVKLGPDGALEQLRRGGAVSSFRQPGLPTRVVDPVGAGDAFTAGYIAAALDGQAPDEILRVANACGAAAVAVLGDQAGLPTRAELERLLDPDAPDTLR